jgi:acyl-CoA thioesterase
LKSMDRDLERSKAMNKLLFGGLVVSAALAAVGLLL